MKRARDETVDIKRLKRFEVKPRAGSNPAARTSAKETRNEPITDSSMYTLSVTISLYYFWRPITYGWKSMSFNDCQYTVEELVQGHIDRRERVLAYSCTREKRK